jgi:hypothetical protein
VPEDKDQPRKRLVNVDKRKAAVITAVFVLLSQVSDDIGRFIIDVCF